MRSRSFAFAFALALALAGFALSPRLQGEGVPAAALATSAPDLAGAQKAFAAGLEAKEHKDPRKYRVEIERAVALLPDPARLLYRLAAARLGDGDAAGAVAAYRRQVDAGFARDPRQDPELAALAPDPAFQAALVALDALAKPVSRSTEAFRLVEHDLVEGIAHDPKTGAFYLSSVHQRKIVRRSKDGRLADFVPSGNHGLLAALGLAVDAEHRRLWVVSAGLPQAKGLESASRNRSALLAFDLDSGAWLRTIDAPPGERSFNDLELAADGSLYVSDPAAHAILKVQPDGSLATLLAGPELFDSPGGLALSADGKLLYVADWTNGLAVIDLALQGPASLAWLRPPAGSSVLGIDGLRRQGHRLLAIQNGIPPARIQSLELSADGRALVSASTLERNLAEWEEPTLGVVVDGSLFYVANSHWPSFGEDGAAPADLATLTPTVVRRLPLD